MSSPRSSSREWQGRKVINPCWTKFTEGFIHSSIRSLVASLGVRAAKYPLTTVGITNFVSIALVAIGYFTNFYLELDQLVFLTPTGSLPDLHYKWISSEESGFPLIKEFYLMCHANGGNALTAEGMRVALQGMQVLYETEDFNDICSESQSVGVDGKPTCLTLSITNFWNHDVSVFEEQLEQVPSNMTQDEWVRTTVSGSAYPDNTPVFHEFVLGNYQGYNTTTKEPLNYTDAELPSLDAMATALTTDNQLYIESAESIIIKIDIPNFGKRTDDLEKRLLDRLHDFRNENNNQDNPPVIFEYYTLDGYQDEMMRALYIDMPLVGVLVVVMLAFTVFIFYDRHEPVKSRGMVGLFSMSTIGASLLAGYGFMWCVGVPFTTVATMLPFVVVGVGLDDTFIITTTYFHLMKEQPIAKGSTEEETTQHILKIVRQTLEEVGVSITMTTTTTLLAFLLGSVSTIPAVRWLCWYAAACLFVVYFYQITCFVALLVLDERRIQAGRKDLCFWIVVDDKEEGEEEEEEGLEDSEINITKDSTQDSEDEETRGSPPSEPSDTDQKDDRSGSETDFKDGVITVATSPSEPQPNQSAETENVDQKPLTQRAMGWYADQLLKPISKITVLVLFAAYFAGTVYSTTLLFQEFNPDDYIPEDSFMAAFLGANRDYSSVFRPISVYFRNVDQADPEIQQQMNDYVDELSQLEQIQQEPPFFWLRDFEKLADSQQAQEFPVNISSLSFNQQIDLMLSIPQLKAIYGLDVVQDPETGNITASRALLHVRGVDMYATIQDQVNFLNDQRDVALKQPVNQPDERVNNELSFFAFDDIFFFWELYDIVVDELIYTTIACVIVVCAITFVMIPHWTALCFVCPLLIMLYFNLLGTMQYCGIRVNSIFYFIIVMAIGLLVDFLMHILLRYYETKGKTRHEKVKETLETMGVPIMLGGFTTFLGVIPLAFSTTEIFVTVFISFFSMVVLGVFAGLVLLPVVLSIWGPVVSTGRLDDDEKEGEPSSVNTFLPDKPLSKSMVFGGVEWDVTDELEA